MNQATKVQISDEIKRILTDKTSTQNKLAKKTGISPAHLVNMKEPDKWKHVSENTWQKAAAFFQKNYQWATVETENFHLIHSVCEDAHRNQLMFAITGKSGLGKTTALKYYARQHNNAHYVLTDYLQKSKDFFRSIAAAMGIDFIGNARSSLQAIVSKVNTMESPLLILDDAGKLNDGNYRNIQLLYDATEGKMGIVIAGTPYLQHYINKMVMKGKMGFDELKRRVEYWNTLQEPTKEEVQFICNENGLTDKECINFLFNSCKEYGTIKATITAARRRDKKITVEILERVRGN